MKAALLSLIFATTVFAAKKKYDERGNVISAPETTGPAASVPPKAPETVEPSKQFANVPDTSTGNAASPVADETAGEEAAALANQKQPLTQVYLENAQMYLRSERLDKTLEFLKKSAEAGEDSFSREAKLQGLWLKARRGDQGLEAEAEGFDEKLKSTALLRVADGYAACGREQPKKKECMNEAERIYAFVGELAPRSVEGRLARVRLGLLLLDSGRLEAALPHLTKTLFTEGSDFKTGKQLKELPLDRAYYNLGELYERPWYHRDTHKAAAAYKQVLKYTGSPYQRAAKERLAYLERFGTGYNRP